MTLKMTEHAKTMTLKVIEESLENKPKVHIIGHVLQAFNVYTSIKELKYQSQHTELTFNAII